MEWGWRPGTTLANYDGVKRLTQLQTKSLSRIGPNNLYNHV
jgi:hypothetical protein